MSTSTTQAGTPIYDQLLEELNPTTEQPTAPRHAEPDTEEDPQIRHPEQEGE